MGLRCEFCQRNDAVAYVLHRGIVLCQECSPATETKTVEASRVRPRSESVSEVWQCPFCESRLKITDDETGRRAAVLGHLIEKHRYCELPSVAEG